MNLRSHSADKCPKPSVVSQGLNKSRPMPCFDPVGSHIIALRKYYLYLEEHLERRAKQKDLEKSGKLKVRTGEKMQYSTIPPFPAKYPFSHSIQTIANSQDSCKMIVKFKGEVKDSDIEQKRMIFIRNVFEQTGFYGIDDESGALKHLSDLLDEFLKKFVGHLGHNRDSEDSDLWSPLETTLRNFGMGGVSGLHSFYYENVAKKHDILLQKCMDMYDELQKL